MIVCPVCQHSNDDYSIKCSSCSSYIQDRVPNLDFYSLIWMIVESPSKAFKRIIIAEHKNFVLFLALFLGIAAIFSLMAVSESGNAFDNLLTLLLFGSVVGTVIALPLFYLLVGIVFGLSKIFKGKGTFSETYGIIGWSLVPVMFSVVFILPLELGTLGMLLFSQNPSALEVKPVVTMVLLGIDGSFLLWSLLLAAIGLSMSHRIKVIVSFFLMCTSVGIVSLLSLFIYSSFNI